MTDPDGTVTGAVAAWHDVTELHRSQVELLAAKDAAEAASRAKGDFLANMSHEIRTPMTSIIGYADLLSGSERPQKVRQEFVQTIRRNGEHLLNLINDLLDLSKIEAGKMTLERIVISPARILADVESQMRVKATEKNIAFVLESTGDLPVKIHNDPTRVRQVLLNLVSNAIKFTKSGEVRITTAYNSQTQMISFSVRDTGIGLTSEQQKMLFQPFVQADTSTTRKFGGTGLGLALCKRLVDMLGGTLTLNSVAGKGSTFCFSVINYPQAEGSSADEHEQEPGTPTHRLHARVAARRRCGRQSPVGQFLS